MYMDNPFNLKLYTTYTGSEFNSKTKHTRFIKFTNNNEIHHNLKYRKGLNIDYVEFKPIGESQEGGMYFSDEFNSMLWLDSTTVWYREVRIPDDALVYVEPNKYKANKFILGSRKPIKSFTINDIKAQKSIVKYDGMALEYISNQTDQLCETAILNNTTALQFVKKQTTEHCRLAIKKNPASILYVLKPNQELCDMAISYDPRTIRYINKKYQTLDLCFSAVKSNPMLLRFCHKQNLDMCMYAVRSNGLALEYVNNQTKDICLEAIKQNGLALQFVKKQTKDMCLAAVKQNKSALKHVKKLDHLDH